MESSDVICCISARAERYLFFLPKMTYKPDAEILTNYLHVWKYWYALQLLSFTAAAKGLPCRWISVVWGFLDPLRATVSGCGRYFCYQSSPGFLHYLNLWLVIILAANSFFLSSLGKSLESWWSNPGFRDTAYGSEQKTASGSCGRQVFGRPKR